MEVHPWSYDHPVNRDTGRVVTEDITICLKSDPCDHGLKVTNLMYRSICFLIYFIKVPKYYNVTYNKTDTEYIQVICPQYPQESSNLCNIIALLNQYDYIFYNPGTWRVKLPL